MGPLTRLLDRRGRLVCPGKEKGFAGCLGARRARRERPLGERQGVSVGSAGDSFRPLRTRAPFCLLCQGCLLPGQRKRVPGETCARHKVIKGRNEISAPTAWNSRAVSTVWFLSNSRQICLPRSHARDSALRILSASLRRACTK